MAHGIEQNLDDEIDSNIAFKSLSELLESGMTLQEAKAYREKISTSTKQKKKIPKASDSELIEKAKELKIFKSLFVIDECHNFFDMDNKVKVWWLTYHRHLYHDIYLITQNLSLVNSKYKPLAESFYKAKASSLTLNKKYFNYMYYTDSRMTKDSFVEVKKVPKRQEVFKLYKSGDIVESKNVIKKFIIIAILLFSLVLLLAYLYYKFSVEEKIKKDFPPGKSVSNSKPLSSGLNKNTFSINKEIESNFSDESFFVLNCSYSSCSNKEINLPPRLLKKFIDMEYIHKYYDEKVGKYLTIVYLSSSKDFYHFISKRSDTDEKDSDSINLFGAVSGK
ncbi:zonular occludens toxin domain-containing protein [Sulfurimonas sp. NW9]|uniref:zonular occludens toxin domain-containing protein n=1 Tax=Sulfurimonas sp. NW9 TaxID=2922728 RepID=UPI003DA88CCC